ncbi:protein Fmp52, mitochondrial [Aspergillus puulaauensis]|uniref:Protein Fmp52, mitochondrial n=1 Tax=Aspergillus puulaauensis TaxID=1220207 RepID=A0A7R7XBZ3_9EURO|nr:protein Fmp52, mitochondrial [Aspergillus puulaauensis]BCS18607.1 protein Fmp52, mitochondrial [Aspergillus puulaauensis]
MPSVVLLGCAGLVPQIFVSAFGTTRAAAGSFANQYALEHDLHLDLARAAKEAGCRVCVLVSSSSAHDRVPDFAYGRMKRGIEDGVRALGFERTVILRPGVIQGQREEARTGEGVAKVIIRGLGVVSPSLRDTLDQDAGVIAEAAVAVGVASLEDAEVEAQPRVRVIERSNILEFATQ